MKDKKGFDTRFTKRTEGEERWGCSDGSCEARDGGGRLSE